jgi:hypothetical protein
MLQAQIPVTVADVSVAHATGEKRGPLIEKVVNVAGDAVKCGCLLRYRELLVIFLPSTVTGL